MPSTLPQGKWPKANLRTKMAQGKSAKCGGNDGFCCVMVSKQGKIYPVVIVNTVHAGCNATLVPGPFTSLPHREQGKKDPGSGW